MLIVSEIVAFAEGVGHFYGAEFTRNVAAEPSEISVPGGDFVTSATSSRFTFPKFGSACNLGQLIVFLDAVSTEDCADAEVVPKDKDMVQNKMRQVIVILQNKCVHLVSSY